MKKQLLQIAMVVCAASSLSNCTSTSNCKPTANIIHGTPAGGAMPIYVLATYKDLKSGGLSAGWFRGWSQAEFEFLRIDSSRRICGTGQTPTCRLEVPIALVAVPKRYLTGEIPGSLALYHVMSGTGDLIGGAGNLLSGIAWFRGVKINFSGDPLATASAYAEGGNGYSNSVSGSTSSSSSNSSSSSTSNAAADSSSRSKVDNTIYQGGDKGHGGGYGGGHKGGGYGGGGDKGGYGGSKGHY
jgi:hypothetical protein